MIGNVSFVTDIVAPSYGTLESSPKVRFNLDSNAVQIEIKCSFGDRYYR